MNQQPKFEQFLNYLQDNLPVQPNAEETADAVVERIKTLHQQRPTGKLYILVKKLTIAAAAILIILFCYQTYFLSHDIKKNLAETNRSLHEIAKINLPHDLNNLMKSLLVELQRNELKTNYRQVLATKFQKNVNNQ